MQKLPMDYPRAIEIIETSRSIGILMAPRPSKDAVFATEVLLRALARRGKTAGILYEIAENALPEEARLLRGLTNLPKEFIISVNTARSPASELRYEKSDERLDIILSPKGAAIRKEDIAFREGKIKADAIISVGITDVDAAAGFLVDDPEIFTRTPIIAFAPTHLSKPFGDVALAEAKPLSELCYRLVSSLGESPPDPETATLLLAGILAGSNGFEKSNSNADTFLAVSELLRAGGNFSAARRLARETRPHALLQLIARATVRSKLDDDQGVFWSFLTADDFEKTGRSEEDSAPVLQALRNEFPQERIIALISQHPLTGKVRADIAAEEAIIDTLEERAGGERASGTIALPQHFENFKDAEDYIRSLLGGAL